MSELSLVEMGGQEAKERERETGRHDRALIVMTFLDLYQVCVCVCAARMCICTSVPSGDSFLSQPVSQACLSKRRNAPHVMLSERQCTLEAATAAHGIQWKQLHVSNSERSCKSNNGQAVASRETSNTAHRERGAQGAIGQEHGSGDCNT